MAKNMLLSRLATILIVLSVCILSILTDGTEKLDYIYSESYVDNVTSESLKCEGIEGRVSDCSECYTCDDAIVDRHRASNNDITKLILNDANCASKETICCVSQKDLKFRESPDRTLCGKYNPEGDPRALRPSIRAVLQGEYPWRAWIYRRQDPETPLCAATFINNEGRTLMTAASCVVGHNHRQLYVLFDKNPDNFEPFNIKKIDIHMGYIRGRHLNDIALLSIESLPEWAHRACLPILPSLHGTSCIAVTQDDYFINQVISRQSKCNEEEQPLDQSLMCSSKYRRDYTPELGAGLYCIDEQSTPNVYTVYGVYLYIKKESVTINANVTHFASWIRNKIEEHRQL